MSVVESVHDLLAPVIATIGVELIDVEWIGASLRVVVDEPGGITTDRLVEVNRLVSPLLDQHDPVPGRYTLEVSSPGVERKLSRPDHYRRAVGEDVIVKLVVGHEPRRIKGRLRAVDEDQITIEARELDGIDLRAEESRTVAISAIDTARTVFEWGPAPKPAKTTKRGHSS